MTPLVSICIPTYNRASTLRQTIKAMLGQTCSDWELIVCDDASPDNTSEVVRSVQDARIRYNRNQMNLGLYGNWNHCIGLATGKYVAIYHDHDVYLPTIVERCVTLLERYPTASFVHTALLMIDEDNLPVAVDIRPFQELMSGKWMARLLAGGWHSPIMAATAMVRRSAYCDVGLYDYERYGFGCDMDMWFRLAQAGDIAYVNDPQALIRARKKGDETALLRWSDILGSLRMRQEQLEQLYKASPLKLTANVTKYCLQRDMRLATVMIRAILLESSDVVSKGGPVVRAEASPWVVFLTEMVKGSTALQTFLRKYVLPIHYERVRRGLKRRSKAAAEYLMKSGLDDHLTQPLA